MSVHSKYKVRCLLGNQTRFLITFWAWEKVLSKRIQMQVLKRMANSVEFHCLHSHALWHWWVVHIRWPWATSIAGVHNEYRTVWTMEKQDFTQRKMVLYEQQVKLSDIHCTLLSWDPMKCPCPIIVIMTCNLKCKYQSQQSTILCPGT